jgi:hypothetical protein
MPSGPGSVSRSVRSNRTCSVARQAVRDGPEPVRLLAELMLQAVDRDPLDPQPRPAPIRGVHGEHPHPIELEPLAVPEERGGVEADRHQPVEQRPLLADRPPVHRGQRHLELAVAAPRPVRPGRPGLRHEPPVDRQHGAPQQLVRGRREVLDRLAALVQPEQRLGPPVDREELAAEVLRHREPPVVPGLGFDGVDRAVERQEEPALLEHPVDRVGLAVVAAPQRAPPRRDGVPLELPGGRRRSEDPEGGVDQADPVLELVPRLHFSSGSCGCRRPRRRSAR